MSAIRKISLICTCILMHTIALPYFGWQGIYGVTMSGNAEFKTGTLTGSGTIIAHNITVDCDDFAFKGTMVCSGQCSIRCKKPFDVSSFTRQGGGKFTVIISPEDFTQYSTSGLESHAEHSLLSNLLKHDEASLTTLITSIRHYAALNSIDENEIFAAVNKALDENIQYHTEHLFEQHDLRELRKLIACSGVSSALIGLACLTFVFKDTLRTRFPSITNEHIFMGIGAQLLFPAFTAISLNSMITEWRTPRHQEKLDKLMLIKETLKKALATAYTLDEKTKVIKLQ